VENVGNIDKIIQEWGGNQIQEIIINEVVVVDGLYWNKFFVVHQDHQNKILDNKVETE